MWESDTESHAWVDLWGHFIKQSKRMCGKRETQYFEAKTTNEQTEIKPHAVLD